MISPIAGVTIGSEWVKRTTRSPVVEPRPVFVVEEFTVDEVTLRNGKASLRIPMSDLLDDYEAAPGSSA